jgi:hypothetical protein
MAYPFSAVCHLRLKFKSWEHIFFAKGDILKGSNRGITNTPQLFSKSTLKEKQITSKCYHSSRAQINSGAPAHRHRLSASDQVHLPSRNAAPNIGGAARVVAFHTRQDDTYILNDHRLTPPRRSKRNNPRLPISSATRKTPEVPLILPLANTRKKKLTSSTTEKLRKPTVEMSMPSRHRRRREGAHKRPQHHISAAPLRGRHRSNGGPKATTIQLNPRLLPNLSKLLLPSIHWSPTSA